MSGETARALGVRAPGEPALLDVALADLTAGAVRVRTRYSGISAGTELTFVKGTNPALRASWDPDLGIFDAGRPGERYPVARLGYMEVGEVTDSRSPAVPAGEQVAMAYGHRSAHVADLRSERITRLPDGLDPLLGIYAAHMGPICANGLLHAATELVGTDVRSLGDGVRGRCVLVQGAGVVGLLCGLFALHHGAAEVAVAESTPERLAAATGLGLWALDETEAPAWARVKERWSHGPRDRGADVVLQCRGRASALAAALRALRPQGTVIDLAFYDEGAADLRLGEEFHHNGLTIRCAQIGRVPRGLAQVWDRARLSRETLALLLARGKAIRAHMITDVVPFEQGPALLGDLAARRRHVIQAVLDFGPAPA